ncbi:MAG: hypothetical protein KDA47_02240, partial [Planctomycetales bacterium]|nr:hypothetical protein [Planctomycetales bacterium]
MSIGDGDGSTTATSVEDPGAVVFGSVAGMIGGGKVLASVASPAGGTASELVAAVCVAFSSPLLAPPAGSLDEVS